MNNYIPYGGEPVETFESYSSPGIPLNGDILTQSIDITFGAEDRENSWSAKDHESNYEISNE
jgi:hypothetical protein